MIRIDDKEYGAALIDMDGVLYDSMPWHAEAWERMMADAGIRLPREEFFLYEGMTGTATIRLIFKRELGRDVPDDECKALYAVKSRYFVEKGAAPRMKDADRMLAAFGRLGMTRVLVTGSAQASLLDRLQRDYPDVFTAGHRVTAHDVAKGKPDPEPYLKGAELAGLPAERCIVVENAPLGVRSGKRAGAFVCAVMTGPIPRERFEEEGTDMIFESMGQFADWLESRIS